MSRIIEVPKKVVSAAAAVVKDAAEGAKEKVGDGAQVVAEQAVDAKERVDKARFDPVFSLAEIENNMPRVIHIADNPRMKAAKVCDGAIGYFERIKGMKMMGLLPENVTLPGVRFLPNTGEILYYRDPFDDHIYIGIDKYYDYLNEVRVNEIKGVAHALGAKHIKVIYKEEKKSLVSAKAKAQAAAKVKGKIKAKPGGAAAATHSTEQNDFSNIEVIADVHYDNSDPPNMPELKYLKNDPAINSLIQRRMDGDRDIKKETYSIRCKNLQGLKREDIAKLDGVLKFLKIGGNASVSSEKEAEERAILEFTIEF